jgi:capsular exopolysaccharide family
MELSITDLFILFKKCILFIVLCILIGLGSFYTINRYFTDPKYTASVQLYVNPNDTYVTADLNELTYAQKVVTTYIGFLQTKQFYEQVIKESGLNYSVNQLKNSTTIASINNTEIFRISVSTSKQKDTYQLIEAMQRIAPIIIKNYKKTAQISIVDPASFPASSSGPNIRRNTMIGGLFGLVFSILITFLLAIINVLLQNEEDLKKKYDIPVLGAIPNYNLLKHKDPFYVKWFPFLRKKLKLSTNQNNMNEDIKFMINEAFHTIRTNIRFTLRKESCKKIIITSPLPDDGKSTVCSNLAITISQTGARVLVIDGDLRKGVLHNFYKVKGAPGLSDVLSGTAGEREVLQNTIYPNLQVIPMGTLPPNPTELVGSLQMDELIKKLEKDFDYIIIDTPPVNIVSDTLNMMKLVDGIVIIVREGFTTHPSITKALSKYRFIDANILGFIINATNPENEYRKKSNYYRKYRKQS